MRITGTSSARAQSYDRNPIASGTVYNNQTFALGTLTTLLTYTVPAGRKALINSVFFHELQVSAGAPAGVKVFRWVATVGGTAANIVSIQINESLANARTMQNSTPQALMAAGDGLTFLGQNGDTGGQLAVIAGSLVTEFDA